MFAIMDQTERNLRMRQNQPGNHFRYFRGFGRRLFQELESNRRIVKQFARNDGRSLRACRFRDALDLSALVNRARSDFFVNVPRGQRQLGYSGNRSQRFTAEAQRMQREQVV